MILRIARDNYFVNRIGRRIVRFFLRISPSAKWTAEKYRVYGTIVLNVLNIKFKVYCEGDDHIANELFYGLNYEKAEFRLIQSLVPKSKFFVDVGANTGIFSLFVNGVNPQIHITSLEPHPANYKRLLKNIGLNDAKTHALPVALGDVTRSIPFTVPKDETLATISSANSEFTQNFSSVPLKTINVSQVTLDSLIGHYPISEIDLIKVDVEYYELQVLQGAIRVLSELRPCLLVEILNYETLVGQFPQMKGVIQAEYAVQIQQLLSSYGYFAYQLTPEGIQRLHTLTGNFEQRNFFFTPYPLPDQFIPYDKVGELIYSRLSN